MENSLESLVAIQLQERYVHSDVTSGEFINGETFHSSEFTKEEVEEGVREFLLWDWDCPEEFPDEFEVIFSEGEWLILN